MEKIQTPDDFRAFFEPGTEVISVPQICKIVSIISPQDIINDRIRNNFWFEFHPIALVALSLSDPALKFRYTAFTNLPFDAVFFLGGKSEIYVECMTIDDVAKYHQRELIEGLRDPEQPWWWSPGQIIPDGYTVKNKKAIRAYKSVDEEHEPDFPTNTIGLLSRLLSNIYEKMLARNNIDYYVFSSYEPPLAYLKLVGRHKKLISSQLKILSSLTQKRFFFSGKDYVIDSEATS